MNKPVITAFAKNPDRGRGLARDMSVRWAFEEVGQPYEVQLVTFEEMKQPPYKKLQPFGQIPSYREGELVLFESGAIVLHIAESHAGLLPTEPGARARAISWLFSALSTMEPPIIEREATILIERDKAWFEERLPMLEERVHKRLKGLSDQLGESAWLEDDFAVGDLMMVMVLRRLENTGLLKDYERLLAYVARATARPAYQRAFAAQRAVFENAQKK